MPAVKIENSDSSSQTRYTSNLNTSNSNLTSINKMPKNDDSSSLHKSATIGENEQDNLSNKTTELEERNPSISVNILNMFFFIK